MKIPDTMRKEMEKLIRESREREREIEKEDRRIDLIAELESQGLSDAEIDYILQNQTFTQSIEESAARWNNNEFTS